MPFAEIDATGWAVIIGAACVGVGGIVTSVFSLVIGFKERKDQRARDDAKIERDRVAAEKVEAVRLQAAEVKSALVKTDKEHGGKLDRIIRVQDGQTERLLRLVAEAARRDADRPGSTAGERKTATDAEAELAAHVAGMAAQNEADRKGGRHG